MTDNINPSHYAEGWSNGAEVIDIAEHLTLNGGAALQYIARSTRVDGNNKGDVVEDLFKAQWYVTREIQRITQDDDFFVDHMTAEIVPRVWDHVEDIPDGVTAADKDGDFWKRKGDDVIIWFRYEDESDADVTEPADWHYDDEHNGPFTEVVEDQ